MEMWSAKTAALRLCNGFKDGDINQWIEKHFDWHRAPYVVAVAALHEVSFAFSKLLN